jgi:hypothetical protein
MRINCAAWRITGKASSDGGFAVFQDSRKTPVLHGSRIDLTDLSDKSSS